MLENQSNVDLHVPCSLAVNRHQYSPETTTMYFHRDIKILENVYVYFLHSIHILIYSLLTGTAKRFVRKYLFGISDRAYAFYIVILRSHGKKDVSISGFRCFLFRYAPFSVRFVRPKYQYARIQMILCYRKSSEMLLCNIIYYTKPVSVLRFMETNIVIFYILNFGTFKVNFLKQKKSRLYVTVIIKNASAGKT